MRAIAATPGITDLSLTTNATLLERLAEPLAHAGLKRVDISLVTLDTDKFRPFNFEPATRNCSHRQRPCTHLPHPRRARNGRLHLSAWRTLLRNLQPPAPDGGWQTTRLPVQNRRTRPAPCAERESTARTSHSRMRAPAANPPDTNSGSKISVSNPTVCRKLRKVKTISANGQ